MKRILSLCLACAMFASLFAGLTVSSVFAGDDDITAAAAFDPDQTIWFDKVPEKEDPVNKYLASKGKAFYGETKSAPMYMIDPNNKGDAAEYGNVKDKTENETVSSRVLSRIMSNNALPIGNGRLGGMVYGAIDKEIVQINEDTFYSLQPSETDYVLDYNNLSSEAFISKNGDTYEAKYNAMTEAQKAKLPAPKPASLVEAWQNITNWSVNIDENDKTTRAAMEDYINCYFLGDPFKQAAYQSFVELYLNFGQEPGGVSNYTRSLDLNSAVANVEYDYNNTHYTRENFVSADKQAVVTRLTADGTDKLNVEAELHAWQHSNITFEKIAENQIAIKGKGRKSDLQFEARLVIDTDGKIDVKTVKSPMSSSTSGSTTTYEYAADGVPNTLAISNATYANCYVVGATSYISDATGVHVAKNDTATPKNRCDEYVKGLGDKPDYAAMKAAHIADYQSYYNRSSVKLEGGTTQITPTGDRFKNFGSSNDSSLVNLYYNFAKYLMISGSREGSQPLNLQGIWNASNMPAWDSKYTININTEMNYWMAQTANLGEFEKPLLEAILELEDSGEAVAKAYYGIDDAFVVHHNFDIWRGASIVDKSTTGLWPVGGAWLLNHAWEYFQFNNDAEYLAKFYPIMKKGLKFFDELMVKDPVTGYLISPASVSPEQGGVQPGPTMDHQLIRNLYKITIESNAALKAAGLLGNEDDSKVAQWQDTMGQICPNEVGSDGYIKEWVRNVTTDASGNKVSVTHKHTSHLWDIFPGNSVNPFADKTSDEQKVYNAFKKSLDKRATLPGTGWSMAWKINLLARMCSGDQVYSMLKTLLSTGTYKNGFDKHPPFQIDGNFGGASGIQECLIQSYADTVNVIPALPKQWSKGEFNNLKARGDFEVSAKWNESKAYEINVKSNDGGQIKLRTAANAGVTDVTDDLGNNIPFTKESKDTVVVFNTEAGRTYSLAGLGGEAPKPEDNSQWTKTAADIVDMVTVPRSSGGTVPKVENASDSDPGNVGYIVDTRHEEGGSKATSEKIGFAVGNCNLTNLKSMSLKVASSYTGASVYVYADSKDGDLVATGKIPNTGGNKIYEDLDLDIINNPGGTHVLYVLVSCDEGSEVTKWICNIKSLSGECTADASAGISLSQSGGVITADVDTAAFGDNSKAVLAIAVYNEDGTLADSQVFDIEKSNLTVQYTAPGDANGKTAKAMLWNSINDMQPLCEPAEIKVSGGGDTPATEAPTITPETPTPSPTATPMPTEPPIPAEKGVYVGETKYDSITAAVAAVEKNPPKSEAERVVIDILPGTYREQVTVNAPYVTMRKKPGTEGEAIITWYYGQGTLYDSANSKGFYDPSVIGDGESYPVKNWGAALNVNKGANGFIGENLSIENSYNIYYTQEELSDITGIDPDVNNSNFKRLDWIKDQIAAGKSDDYINQYLQSRKEIPGYTVLKADKKESSPRERSAAFYSSADMIQMIGCDIISTQDTMGINGGRIYFENSRIGGTTDYICGSATAVFNNCELYTNAGPLQSEGATVTAPSNPIESDGYLFYNCRITGSKNSGQGTLGRPWSGVNASANYINTEIGYTGGSTSTLLISDKAWDSMGGVAPKEARFAEYGSVDPKGNAVKTSLREGRVLNEWTMLRYNPLVFMQGTDGWDPAGVKEKYSGVNNVIEGTTIDTSDNSANEVTLPAAPSGYEFKWESNSEFATVSSDEKKLTLIRPANGEQPIKATVKLYARDASDKELGGEKSIEFLIQPTADVTNVFTVNGNVNLSAASDADQIITIQFKKGDAIIKTMNVVVPSGQTTVGYSAENLPVGTYTAVASTANADYNVVTTAVSISGAKGEVKTFDVSVKKMQEITVSSEDFSAAGYTPSITSASGFSAGVYTASGSETANLGAGNTVYKLTKDDGKKVAAKTGVSFDITGMLPNGSTLKNTKTLKFSFDMLMESLELMPKEYSYFDLATSTSNAGADKADQTRFVRVGVHPGWKQLNFFTAKNTRVNGDMTQFDKNSTMANKWYRIVVEIDLEANSVILTAYDRDTNMAVLNGKPFNIAIPDAEGNNPEYPTSINLNKLYFNVYMDKNGSTESKLEYYLDNISLEYQDYE